MIVVLFLRWLFGYFEFNIIGKFPERFLNLAAKNGVNLWDMKGSKGELLAKAKIGDYDILCSFAEKTDTEIDVIREFGFPYLCSKYKHRTGLLVGLIIGSLICVFLSGFVWKIEINASEGICEYEIRNELRSLGLYEGSKMSEIDITDIEMKMKTIDKRISWISINEIGTKYSVELSHEETRKNNNSKSAVSNFIANDDGVISKVSIRKGKSVVSPGEGVHEGQLIASGITEYSDGSNLLSDCEGEIYAVTKCKTVFSIPKENTAIVTEGKPIVKKQLNILGIDLPLTFVRTPDGNNAELLNKYRITLNGSDLPVGYSERVIIPYSEKQIMMSADKAKNCLLKRKKLYEVFVTACSTNKILSSSETFSENDKQYLLIVDYSIEKNICRKSYIELADQKDDISNSGT